MSAVGATPIQLYHSTTAATAPADTNLVAGELAINTLDEKLYFKNSAGVVKVLANSAISGIVPGTGVATFLTTPSSANLAAAVTDETGTGALVFATSPTLVTPALGTPASGTMTNTTGLPIATGVSGLGTGVATALAVNVGSAGAPVVNGGALGTPSSGSAANLTSFPTLNQNTTGTAGGLTGTPNISVRTIGATVGTFTKAAVGDSIIWTNGGATPKAGYLFSDASSVGMFTGANSSGTALGLYMDVTNNAIYGAIGVSGNKLTLTSTGLNSTAIGQGVGGAAAGSFTTLSATGITSTSDTTDATSTTAASLKTAGGLAVAKKAYFGDSIYSGNCIYTAHGTTTSIASGVTEDIISVADYSVWQVYARGGSTTSYFASAIVYVTGSHQVQIYHTGQTTMSITSSGNNKISITGLGATQPFVWSALRLDNL